MAGGRRSEVPAFRSLTEGRCCWRLRWGSGTVAVLVGVVVTELGVVLVVVGLVEILVLWMELVGEAGEEMLMIALESNLLLSSSTSSWLCVLLGAVALVVVLGGFLYLISVLRKVTGGVVLD